MLDVRVFCRVVLPIALPGALSTAVFTFLASFDQLLISMFFAGVHTGADLEQPQPAGRADDRRVSASLIGVTILLLSIDGVPRPRQGQRRGRD